jgi:hypothetical protein
MNTSVIFRWKGPDNERFQGVGVTRDMSVAGIFILTPTCPPTSAVVQMEVVLRPEAGKSETWMKADMTVMRVEHDIAGYTRSWFSAFGKGFRLATAAEQESGQVANPIDNSGVESNGQK